MFSNPLNVKIFTYNLRPHAEEVNVLPAFYASKALNMKKEDVFLYDLTLKNALDHGRLTVSHTHQSPEHVYIDRDSVP